MVIKETEIEKLKTIIEELKKDINYSRKQQISICNRNLLFNFKNIDINSFSCERKELIEYLKTNKLFIINLNDIIIITK